MIMKNNLPLYTPSVLDPETLQAIFVKREKLLNTLVEKHTESVLKDSKAFSLLVAPRGMGKTHLMSMLYHRLKQDEQLHDKMLMTWLREEEWGIASYLDLLTQILRGLQNDYDNIEPDVIDQLFELPLADAEYKAEKYLEKLFENKVLVILAENLNVIFEGIDKDGQEKLRAFIQNTGKITIAAASQSLFASVTSRNKPFYGFFNVTHLEKFTLDDAISLLMNIAKTENNDELIAVLETEEGRSRIRALHHLAGGSPRIYVLFSQFIQADSLDDFTGPIMKMLDELTPYYQAKMMELSAQQRKIIMFLCRDAGAVTVQAIAKQNHVSQQTASSQLKKLRDAGFVESTQYGRQSYYEIAEPLLRMVLSVKDNRGAPVKLAIDLIRHFFTVSELKQLHTSEEINLLGIKCLTKELVHSAINHEQPSPHIVATVKDFEQAFREKNYQATHQIINQYHDTSEDEFQSVFNGLIDKLFTGRAITVFSVMKQLFMALPEESSLKFGVFIKFFVYFEVNNIQISSKSVDLFLSRFTKREQAMLSILIFVGGESVCKIITFETEKKDRLISKIVERLSFYSAHFNDDLMSVEKLISFVENLSKFDYLSLIISSIFPKNRKLPESNIHEIFKQLVAARDFSIQYLNILIAFCAITENMTLLEVIKAYLQERKEHKDIIEFGNIVTSYLNKNDPKELLSLPKEIRTLILNTRDDDKE